MGERNREKEEKLFRAMSGVDEELLLRSEQSSGKDTGKVRRFPIQRISRVAAACLCFVVMGAVFVTVRNSSKMADSTSNDTAAPQSMYSVAEDQAVMENEEAADAGMPEAAMAQAEAEIPEGEAASPGDMDGMVLEGALQDAEATEKQSGQMSADAMTEASVSGNEAVGADSTEETKDEADLTEKQARQLQRKMTTKGQ